VKPDPFGGLLRLRNDTNVRLGAFHPSGYCFLASSSETEPAMITSSRVPVDRRRDLVLAVSCSDRSPGALSKLRPWSSVDQDQLDLLVWTYDEDFRTV